MILGMNQKEYKTIEKVLLPSSIYNILKNNNMNVLDDNMIGNSKKNIKRIIKDNIGDLGYCLTKEYN